MTTALAIIVDAFERLNRLSAGESLGADDAALGFRRLNGLVDELSAESMFLYEDRLTEAVQTGDVTLGVGAWASIAPGAGIIGITADNCPLQAVTTLQYNGYSQPVASGLPRVYAHDGMALVRFYPTPANNTLRIQTRRGVLAFVDQETEYQLPPGYFSALAAGLAVRLAPNVLGNVPQTLVIAEARAMLAVRSTKPAIIHTSTRRAWNILTGG
jgi:ribosomal protein L30E